MNSSKDSSSVNTVTLQVAGRPRSHTIISMVSSTSVWSSVSAQAEPHERAAVQAKQVSLVLMNSLEPVLILNRLNLNVQKGTIYGLLGPSGCGKTSFLRCLIGFQPITSGKISVFGYPPGDERSGVPGRGLGYMPQDLALHEYLTIGELLTYYGNLYLIETETLKKRIDRLVHSLDLPDKDRLVINLSGGQRRRVSFALTIVHKPRLLILDEPTVGCDPILRERIWESLTHFSTVDRITIIITTHYIEEARRSHRVGFMRAGSILVEDSPNELMDRMGSDTLEKVFLTLVMDKSKDYKNNNQLMINQNDQQEQQTSFVNVNLNEDDDNEESDEISTEIPNKFDYDQNVSNNCSNGRPRSVSYTSTMVPVKYPISEVSEIKVDYEKPIPVRKKNLETRILFWYYTLVIVIQNIAMQIKRTPTTIIVQFVIPLISVMCFCMFVGQIPFGLRLGVVNKESPLNLSSLLLSTINQYVFVQVPFDSVEEARAAGKSQDVIGWIEIPDNFTTSLVQRYQKPQDFTNDTYRESTLLLHLDVTNWPISVTIERSFEYTYLEFVKRMMKSFGRNPAITKIPIEIPEIIYGSMERTDYSGFREFVSVGILVIISYTIAFGATILVVLLEKVSLIFERNFAAGVTTSQLILGHLITRVAVQSIVVIGLFMITLALFEIPSKGSYATAVALLLAHSLTGATHGICVSAMSTSLFMASIFSNAVIIFFFIIGGVLWPYNSLPYYLKWVALISPITLPTESLRGVLVRGWSFTHPQVIEGFAVSLGWTLIFLFGALQSFKYGISSATR